MKQQLDFQELINQSIVEGATTPNPGAAGVLCWSTSDSTVKRWNATSWNQLGSVSSVALSGGTTGLTATGGPITTSGTITLGGTLAIGYGGTGLNSTPSNGQLLIGNGTNYTLATLTGTANQLAVTNGSGSITLSLPSQVNATNVAVSGQLQTSTATVAAAGSNQGGATALTASSVVVTSGTGGVALPTPLGSGLIQEVVNQSGAAIIVYPASGGTIDANGTNTGVSVANTATVQFVSTSTTQWYTIGALNVVAAGTAISLTLSSGTLTVANTGVTSNVAGTGITVSGATGAVTITNAGVTSLAGTALQITASASTGAVTLSLPTPSAAITAASSGINTAETVIQKLLVGTPPTTGSTYCIEAIGTCTATVANLSTFTVRVGTAGTTSDTSVGTLTATSPTSGTTIPFYVKLFVTFRSATSVIITGVLNNSGTTGISATTNVVAAGSATTITNANNYIDLTYKSAASTTTSTFQSAVIYQVR